MKARQAKKIWNQHFSAWYAIGKGVPFRLQQCKHKTLNQALRMVELDSKRGTRHNW